MLFKALNPEMFLELVDFFLANFFKEFAIVCPHIRTKEKIRTDVAIPTATSHILAFINAL